MKGVTERHEEIQEMRHVWWWWVGGRDRCDALYPYDMLDPADPVERKYTQRTFQHL